MSPISTKRVHWEDDFDRFAAPSPFYVNAPRQPNSPLPPASSITRPIPLISQTPAISRTSPMSPLTITIANAFPPASNTKALASAHEHAGRIAPHPAIASEPACNPPLGRVFILVEIDRAERFNVEVYAGPGGSVTVNDVLARLQNVLRERLEPGVTGGCYKERCGCGCGAIVDRRSGFTTMFDGLSVRSNGDQNKWRIHLRRVRYRV
ncbi:hypothetical protein EDD18DRAFT_1112200 [Armillaria luteobubalina]|uniref:DUF6699 domain-containing protein n=1 Tax=Armillaria luteobubalina TaxID=153913 RepID=A0AA39PJ30_9AGAR|nr:hypothetical protein EDD18DRAFT_1112200 [Armillaria luteobubalina]